MKGSPKRGRRRALGRAAIAPLREAQDMIDNASDQRELARAMFMMGAVVNICMLKYNVLIGQVSQALGTSPKRIKKYSWVARNFNGDINAFMEHFEKYTPPHIRNRDRFIRTFESVTKHLFDGELKVHAGTVKPEQASKASKPESAYRSAMSHTAELIRMTHEWPDPRERLDATNKLMALRKYMIANSEPPLTNTDPYFIPYSLCAACAAEPAEGGHHVKTSQAGVPYPICSSCDELGREPDMERVARMYHGLAKEATFQLDEFRDSVRTYG